MWMFSSVSVVCVIHCVSAQCVIEHDTEVVRMVVSRIKQVFVRVIHCACVKYVMEQDTEVGRRAI